MGFVQNTQIRTTGRVRVTRRITSEPDAHGRSRLVARKGEEISVAEALRRGIAERDLEPIGPGGKVVMEGYRRARKAEGSARAEAIAELQRQSRDAERLAQQDADAERAARIRGQDPAGAVVFPRHRGGTNWELSDGTLVQAETLEDAQAAEADLHDDMPDNATPRIEWIGEDPERARAALADEDSRGDKARTTVQDHARQVLEAATTPTTSE